MNPHHSPKVLIVDDQPANLFALDALLSDLDVNLIHAGSGNEALGEMLRHEFALVLLDVQMPGMDGFEVAELMQKHDATRAIPIIFVTAMSTEERHVFQGYESGAVDYLFKPLDPVILASKVRVFLKLYRQKQELNRLIERAETNNERLKHEIGERMAVEQELRKLSQAIEQSPASVIITDTKGKIEFTNAKFEQTTGYATKEVLGRTIDYLKSEYSTSPVNKEIRRCLAAGEAWRGEIRSKKKNGKLFWEHISVSPIRRTNGVITSYVSVHEDITLRKEYEEKLLRQANYDDVTNLPNRILALDRIIQESGRVQRIGVRMAVMFIDLDDFKRINEDLGHVAGDRILGGVANRLGDIVRKGDTVARLGGDEFLMVLVDFDSGSGAEITARKILRSFAEPFAVDDRDIFITASIGITYAPDDTVDPHVLMQNAEAAMYRAKQAGRNTYEFFTREINVQARRRLSVETHLRKALDADGLDIHFQPIHDIRTGLPVKSEALARWDCPVLGVVPPEQFIPIAENTGLIHALGDWILSQAVSEAKLWAARYGRTLPVAVNFSSRQFHKGRLVRRITRALGQSGAQPEMLEMEITEGLLLQNDNSIVSLLSELRKMGIRLTIDDFGTGYSSLSYLKRFPIDILKIDKSFIRNVTTDIDDSVLIQAIVAMATGLGMEVVAEGVETREQLAVIRQHDCGMVQGYYWGKPLPKTEYRAYLDDILTTPKTPETPRDGDPE